MQNKMTCSEFVSNVIDYACDRGFHIELGKNNKLYQIDFGHKKLHAEHLEKLYPEVLYSDADISSIINKVARGRPCTHKPMKENIARLRQDKGL